MELIRAWQLQAGDKILVSNHWREVFTVKVDGDRAIVMVIDHNGNQLPTVEYGKNESLTVIGE